MVKNVILILLHIPKLNWISKLCLGLSLYLKPNYIKVSVGSTSCSLDVA